MIVSTNIFCSRLMFQTITAPKGIFHKSRDSEFFYIAKHIGEIQGRMISFYKEENAIQQS